MPHYQLAIFDMAGTTINDYDEVYRVLRTSVEREGAEFDDATFQQWMGTEKKYAITNLLRLGGAKVSRTEQAWQWFREELARTYTERPPVPLDGIPDALATLRAGGVKVALTTGFSREIVDIILGAMGWGENLDLVVAGDEVPHGRPEPDMILKAMNTLGINNPAQVISTGDTEADVRSAQAAGVTSVGVLTGHVSREEFNALNADHVLDSAAGIVKLAL